MLFQNAIKIKEKGKPAIYLNSCHRHDCITYKFENNAVVGTDGGNYFNNAGYYSRSILGQNAPTGTIIENWCLTESSTIQDILDKTLWGTRGKDGKSPLSYKPIKSFTKAHLVALSDYIKTGGIKVPPFHMFAIEYWLNNEE